MTTRRPTRRRARPQLDRESIIDALLRLAARPGTRTVTVRTLGSELGADPTAIYRHYADKDAMVRDAIDRLYGQIHAALPVDADWRTRLQVMGVTTLDAMLAHPAVGSQLGRLTTGGPHELAAVEFMLAAFREAGLDDADSVRYYATLSSYILSFSASEAGSLIDPELSQDGPDPRWLADYSGVDGADYPNVASLQPALRRLQDREVFLTGLDILLDSAAARAALRRSRTTVGGRR